jgi:hypothetical protein
MKAPENPPDFLEIGFSHGSEARIESNKSWKDTACISNEVGSVIHPSCCQFG